MEETFNTDIVNGKLINWDKMSIEELDELKEEAEKKEAEIIQKIFNFFNAIIEE